MGDGCVICLDGFSETERETQRPAAYPCGHIVHRGCANSYYDTQATANFPQFSCPLCKGRYQSKDEIRTLYPPTTGLNVRNIKTCDEMVAAIMSTQAQEDTINQLLDFQQLIMTWAKAVRDVDLQTVELAGDKVRKLIPRLSGQDHHDWNNRFNGAIGSVEAILPTLREEIVSLRQLKEKNRRRSQKQTQEREKLDKDQAELKAKEIELALRIKQCSEINDKIQEERVSIISDRSDLKNKDKERARLVDEANTKARKATMEADKAHKSAALRIKENDEKLRNELNRMTKMVEEAQREREEAEKERDATQAKNGQMATQLRGYMNDIETLRKSKKLHKEKKEEMESELNEKIKESEREIKRLRFKFERLEKQMDDLKSKSTRANGSSTLSSINKNLLPSSSPSPSSSRFESQSPSVSKFRRNGQNSNKDNGISLSVKGFDDGDDDELEIVGGPSNPDFSESYTSTDLELSQHYGTKRKRGEDDYDLDLNGCSFIESEDLSLEMDEEDYPMPGMNAIKNDKAKENRNGFLSFRRVSSDDKIKKQKSVFNSTSNNIHNTSSSSSASNSQIKTHPFFKTPALKTSGSKSSATRPLSEEEIRKAKEMKDKLEHQVCLQQTLGLDKKGNSTAQVIGPKHKIRAYT